MTPSEKARRIIEDFIDTHVRYFGDTTKMVLVDELMEALAQPTEQLKWEYEIVEPADSFTQAGTKLVQTNQLNSMGAYGWELVTISNGGYMIFKRPKRK